jgi:hypothetical protein
MAAVDVSGWDWVTISALATALGTFILAMATFASVRSGNRAARNAERALQADLRPLLFPSRFSDEIQKVGFADGHWVQVPGGHGVVEVTDDAIYLAISLRNVGNGMAVLHGWYVSAGLVTSDAQPVHEPVEHFRRLTRDLWVPPHDVFFWQGAVRDTSEPVFAELEKAAYEEIGLRVELLYGDDEGGQRTVTRLALIPRHPQDDEPVTWIASVNRHWTLDRANPR